MSEVHEYEESLKDAVEKMKGSLTTFLEAHGSTLEVLKVVGEVGVSEERFHKAVERKFQCMFCKKSLKCIMYRSTIYSCTIGKIGIVR